MLYVETVACAIITSRLNLATNMPGIEGLVFTRSVYGTFQFTIFACVKPSFEFMPAAAGRKTNIE